MTNAVTNALPIAQTPEDSCGSILKLLADDTRLRVVLQLLEGPKHVKEINAAVAVEQSLLSHHLKVLRDGGIVEAERDGKGVLYRLSPSVEARRAGRSLDLGCCRLSFD